MMQINIRELFDTLLQSADLPLLTAFVLGLLVALNPCQLAISVSALAYEYRNGKRLIDGLVYALGRTITYTAMGWVTMCLIGGGANVVGLQQVLSKAEVILPYVLIALGLYMLYRAFHRHHHHGDNCHNSGRIIKRNGPLGSLVLGMTLAFAFCPESAIFYFGMMIPLSISSSVGAIVPLVFGLSASIPVVAIAWMMNKAVNGAERLSRGFEYFQQGLNGVTGLLFIAIAILLMTQN
ncbi:MAG: sulfite exporter TauE/SafE family protein [Bacteroidaceae bacterium]|jgi:cytochrome c biogenesis protein CcdA|nr:sulfite exporter TauE/SafE family protein [Bacteroidaceae bacterium]